MSNKPRRYCPSNGTEGMSFIEHNCMNCIHEKYSHTLDDNDLKCDILSRTMLYKVTDPEYPDEWQYNDEGSPCCTSFKHWDWGFGDDEGGGYNEPPPPEPYNPNQMVMPFALTEVEQQLNKELCKNQN